MRRTLTIATFLLLCTSAALSQRSPGMGSGRSFGGSHSAGGARFGGSHFAGAPHFGGTRVFVGGSFGFGHNHFGVAFGHGFHGHFHSGFSFGFFGAPFYGYGYYPYYAPYYYYPPYAYPPAYPVAYQTAPQDYDRSDDSLAREVDRLRGEVDRLNQERYGSSDRERVPQPPPRSESRPPATPATTVLVFRNGKREETTNYAIAGQTLWIFSETRARKVPLADLDLEATRAINEERGVEFNGARR